MEFPFARQRRACRLYVHLLPLIELFFVKSRGNMKIWISLAQGQLASGAKWRACCVYHEYYIIRIFSSEKSLARDQTYCFLYFLFFLFFFYFLRILRGALSHAGDVSARSDSRAWMDKNIDFPIYPLVFIAMLRYPSHNHLEVVQYFRHITPPPTAHARIDCSHAPRRRSVNC